MMSTDDFEDGLDLVDAEEDGGEFETGVAVAFADDDEDVIGDGDGSGSDEGDDGSEALQQRAEEAERERDALLAQAQEREAEQRAAEVAALKEKADLLRARRKEALDEDDLDAFSKLDEELGDVEYRRRRLEEEPPRRAADDAGGDAKKIAPAAKDWIDRNAAWFDPKSPHYDSVRARKAIALEAKYAGQYGRDSEKLYEQIDKQLDYKPPRRRDQVAGAGRASGVTREPGPNSARRATPAEKRVMQRFGLDANNPRDLRAYRMRDAPLT